MTAYVYPARPPYAPSLAAHFAQCQQEIRGLWGRTRRISRSVLTIRRHGREYPGMEEVFGGKIPGTRSEAVSRLMVYTTGDRYVKFRFSAPKAAGDQAAAQARLFVDRFPWPR
jgi:hypothetical protein